MHPTQRTISRWPAALALWALNVFGSCQPGLAAPQSPSTATYYVSTSGSDGNAGTSAAAPFKTIGKVNGFYHAQRAGHIWAQGDKTLAQWRTYSGKDAASTELISTTLATAEIFYNDTPAAKAFPLVRPYRDLSGSAVTGSITLQPFTSRILLPTGPALHRAFLPVTK